MHYHCEIILPPNVDMHSSIESVMKPFYENGDPEETTNPFYDFYVVGGRFAGSKFLASLDQNKLDSFYEWMKEENVTVAGLQCGKQELSPATQQHKVDAKWSELFHGGTTLVKCPLFKHSNDQYSEGIEGVIDGDISLLGKSLDIKCSRVIFCGPSYDIDSGSYIGPIEAVFMVTDSVWNGVNHMGIDWDGRIGTAYEMFKERLDRYSDKYKSVVNPGDDWIAVTVDYHS